VNWPYAHRVANNLLRGDAVAVAPRLLGCLLVYEVNGQQVGGYIVETEAYRSDDAASHAFGGPGMRNASMYKEAGTIYVYFTYGMHFCMNIVTGKVGDGQGVLIRALQPAVGIELMTQRRPLAKTERELANGPAKLTQALGIDMRLNGTRLGEQIHITSGFVPDKVTAGPRVGITKNTDLPWRFFITDNPYVSNRRAIL
jgi:DNA-3-methyladenine glycosylase